MEKRSKEKIINVEVYTDGSLKKVGQKMTFGGWAFIVVVDSKMIYYAAGGETSTTNQRMELQAIIEGLKYAQSIRRDTEKVVIFSDSAYAINCYTQEWYIKWMLNGWISSGNKEVANKDLWEQIIPFFDDFWYSFHKVKGHAGIVWNERCDELAQAAAEKQREMYRGRK